MLRAFKNKTEISTAVIGNHSALREENMDVETGGSSPGTHAESLNRRYNCVAQRLPANSQDLIAKYGCIWTVRIKAMAFLESCFSWKLTKFPLSGIPQDF